MNMNQFTQKTIEAIQRAQQIAVEYGHQQVDQEHVMLALTEDGASLIPQLLTKCGLSVDSLRELETRYLISLMLILQKQLCLLVPSKVLRLETDLL